MNPVVHPFIKQWLILAKQAQYYHYSSSETASQIAIQCISLDVMRTFPNQQLELQKSSLRKNLTSAAAEFSDIGYRSGFNYIMAAIDKLTNYNQSHTMSIFRFIMYSKNIGLGLILTNNSHLHQIVNIFDDILKKQIPQVFQQSLFSSQILLTPFISFLAYNIQWQNNNNLYILAVLWDKIFNSNIYMVIEILIEYVKTMVTALKNNQLKIIIDQDNYNLLEKAKLRETKEYSCYLSNSKLNI